MNIGVSTRLNHKNPVEAVQEILGLGREIHAIEILCREAIPYTDLSNLKQLSKKYELEYYVHAPFVINEDNLPPSGVSRWYWRKVEESIHFAEDLNSNIVTFHPGPLLPKSSEAAISQSQAGPTIVGRQYLEVNLEPLKALCELAAGKGITLSLENLGKGPGADISYLNSILASFPSLACTFDVGHAYVAGNFDELLTQLSPNIRHLHLHDNKGNCDSHLPLGMGTIDYPSVLKKLNPFDAKGILELSSKEEVGQSLNYLASIDNGH